MEGRVDADARSRGAAQRDGRAAAGGGDGDPGSLGAGTQRMEGDTHGCRRARRQRCRARWLDGKVRGIRAIDDERWREGHR